MVWAGPADAPEHLPPLPQSCGGLSPRAVGAMPPTRLQGDFQRSEGAGVKGDGAGRAGTGGSDGEGHRWDEGVFFLLQDGLTTQTGQEPVSRMCAWTWE